MTLTNIKNRLLNYVKFIRSKRNLIAFVIFGFTSNVGFSVSLTAAQDLLDADDDSDTRGVSNMSFSFGLTKNSSDISVKSGNVTSVTEYLVCNDIGTGAILIIAVVPEMVVKLLLQFSCINISYRVRIILLTLMMAAGFLTLAFADHIWINFVGVIFSSCTIGIAEQTFMAMTSFYSKEVVTAWSTGGGAAALLGSFSYAGLKSLGVTTSEYMLIVLFVPVLNAFTYVCILQHKDEYEDIENVGNDESKPMISKDIKDNIKPFTLRQKMSVIPSLLQYLVPYTGMYFFVYLINQGLFELIYFNIQWISRESQYRWFNTLYRIGSFLARCLTNYIKTRKLWVPTFITFLLTGILVGHVFERFIPYVWIVMLLIFVEGFLQGMSYVSTFFGMTNNLDPMTKEFGLGLVTVGGPLGITLAGFCAVPFHNFICSLDLKM